METMLLSPVPNKGFQDPVWHSNQTMFSTMAGNQPVDL
jgi:hypothetical protein